LQVTAAGGPRYASAAQAMATATLFGTGWLTSLTFVQAGREALGLDRFSSYFWKEFLKMQQIQIKANGTDPMYCMFYHSPSL